MVSMATKGEEDKAGAWQSTVKQTDSTGVEWGPHHVGEYPQGSEQEKKNGGGETERVQQKQKLFTDSGLFWALEGNFFKIMQHQLYLVGL